MESVIKYINEWFLPKSEHFEAFAKNDTRVESWFKAELLVLFEKLARQKVIDSFEREPKLDINGRKQVDFSINIKGEQHYLELKAVCISRSKGTPRNLFFYLRDDNVGMIKDFGKLDKIKGLKNKWILAFIYPRPTEENWLKACKIIHKNFSHWECITRLETYPQRLFIAIFRASDTFHEAV